MKKQTSITYWLPGGYSMSYHGVPMSRFEWLRRTWRGYFAMWVLIAKVARVKSQAERVP